MEALRQQDDALDCLAPIFSNDYWSRPKKLTPQLLCTLEHPQWITENNLSKIGSPTGFAPCDPILAFERFLFSATDDGRVCVYTINISPSTEAARPICVAGPFYKDSVSVAKSPAIVALAATDAAVRPHERKPTSQRSPDSHVLGRVAVLTSHGDVHLLELRIESSSFDLNRVHSWTTRYGSATCMSFHPSFSTPDACCLRLCVGSETGYLTDWEISVPVHGGVESNTSPSTVANEKQKNIRAYVTRLVWRGLFESSVNSISSLGSDIEVDDDGLVDDAARESMSYLSVNLTYSSCRSNSDESQTIVSKPRREVINVTSVEEDFTMETNKLPDGGDLVVPLENYCIWPKEEAGLDVVELSALNEGPVPWRKASLSNVGFACQFNFRKSWGTSHEKNELFVGYPGAFSVLSSDARDSRGDTSQVLTYCSRRGTVYVAPVRKNEDTPPNQLQEVFVFHCVGNANPDSRAGRPRYAQGFTCRNALVRHATDSDDKSQRNMPVFVCSCMVGTLYVYAPGLLPYHSEWIGAGKPTEERFDVESTMSDMATNGTIEYILDLLLSLDETDALLVQDIWKSAWKECTRSDIDINKDVVTRAILKHPRDDFPRFRALLMWLSQEERT